MRCNSCQSIIGSHTVLRLLCFIFSFSFRLPPDGPLDKTAVVVLLFYPNVQCLNYMRIALILIVVKHYASDVRLSLPKDGPAYFAILTLFGS